MTFELDISSMDLAEQVQARFEEVRVPIQAAMANRFASIVNHKFGQEGEDRPWTWQPLTRNYADTHHGGNRIPTETLTGDLQASIQIDEMNPDHASVWTDCPYAAEQQWGTQFVPARPFFPLIGTGMDDAELTPYALDQVMRAAENEAERLLR
jgi:phage gpG-like protein